MNNDYCIIKQPHTKYNAIIVGLSRNSLTDFFDDIATDLSNNNINGLVLFDYYNYNHSLKRRFFETEFKNNTISSKSFKLVNNSDVINFIYKIYKKNPTLEELAEKTKSLFMSSLK